MNLHTAIFAVFALSGVTLAIFYARELFVGWYSGNQLHSLNHASQSSVLNPAIVLGIGIATAIVAVLVVSTIEIWLR